MAEAQAERKDEESKHASPAEDKDSQGSEMDSMFAQMLSRADSAKTKTKGYSAGQDMREDIDSFNAKLAKYNSIMLEQRGGWGLGEYPEAVEGKGEEEGKDGGGSRLVCKNVKAAATRGACFVIDNALSSQVYSQESLRKKTWI